MKLMLHVQYLSLTAILRKFNIGENRKQMPLICRGLWMGYDHPVNSAYSNLLMLKVYSFWLKSCNKFCITNHLYWQNSTVNNGTNQTIMQTNHTILSSKIFRD